MRVGSIFTGIGGFDLAFERAGAEIAWQVEIEDSCGKVLARHWPTVPRYRDVQEVSYDRLLAELGERAAIDVLVGGFPCTDLSVAGRRAGLAGSESGLFWEFHRLADEIRPRWLVIENVDGLLSSNEGRDMGTVVGALAQLGFVGAWRCLDAQYFGLAQRRRRVFFVCHLGKPWSAPAEVLFEPESCGGNPPPRHQATEVDPEGAEDGLGGDDYEDDRDDYLAPVTTATMTSKWAKGSGGPSGDETQNLVIFAPPVSKPLMHGGDGSRRDDLDGGAYIVHQGVEQRGRPKRDVESVTNTLTASMLSGNGAELKHAEAGFVIPVDQRTFSVYPETGQASILKARETDLSPAITAAGLSQVSDRGTFVVAPVDLRNATRTDTAIGEGTPGTGLGEDGDPSYTLTSTAPAAVAYRKSRRSHGVDDGETWVQDELANTLNTYENHTAMRTTHAVVEPNWTVRRLTPLECERLQGFPDQWTQFDRRGAVLFDTPRYRQLGNAVAVPVAYWIARRLVAIHQQIERKP